MDQAKKEFVEPELITHEDKLADVTAGFNGYRPDLGPDFDL